jgi:hypothetical protein
MDGEGRYRAAGAGDAAATADAAAAPPPLPAPPGSSRTLAIVKPDAFARAADVLHLAELAGFTVICRRAVQVGAGVRAAGQQGQQQLAARGALQACTHAQAHTSCPPHGCPARHGTPRPPHAPRR